MLSCRKKIFPYSIERYKKDKKGKIQMVCEIVESPPSPKGAAYSLCDSWFTNEKVINTHFKKGYHLIGALKTNRVIYPKWIGFQVKQFAQYIERNDVCLAPVNNSKYWIYRCKGHLNGVDNDIVLLCTDTELNNQTILEYYSKRWPIEIFFRQTKNNLGLNTY